VTVNWRQGRSCFCKRWDGEGIGRPGRSCCCKRQGWWTGLCLLLLILQEDAEGHVVVKGRDNVGVKFCNW
jgi:hypothetical protein